jgi:hypothetical protein
MRRIKSTRKIVKKSAKNIEQKIWEKTLKEEIRESQIGHSVLNCRAEKPTKKEFQTLIKRGFFL